MSHQQVPMPDFVRHPHRHQLTLYSNVSIALSATWILLTLALTISLRKVNLGSLLLIAATGLTWYMILFGISVAVVSVQSAVYSCTEELKQSIAELAGKPKDGDQ